MSTITVTNIKATGETASRAATGVAGAWCDYSGSGTTLLASSNVSSATDNGTGDYTFNLTNAFGSANYTGVVDALNTDSNNFDTFIRVVNSLDSICPSTLQVRVKVTNVIVFFVIKGF